jgi:hypothetical protein
MRTLPHFIAPHLSNVSFMTRRLHRMFGASWTSPLPPLWMCTIRDSNATNVQVDTVDAEYRICRCWCGIV